MSIACLLRFEQVYQGDTSTPYDYYPTASAARSATCWSSARADCPVQGRVRKAGWGCRYDRAKRANHTGSTLALYRPSENTPYTSDGRQHHQYCAPLTLAGWRAEGADKAFPICSPLPSGGLITKGDSPPISTWVRARWPGAMTESCGADHALAERDAPHLP